MKKKIPHRRRREKKTNYNRRLKLLKSGEYRLVIRKSNNSIMGQIIKYEKSGDKTVLSSKSSDLSKFGWKGHFGNIPAAYLTGLALGKKTADKKIKKVVFDIGLQESTKGNRIYVFLKGFLDSGVAVPHSTDMFSDEERIKGKHINDDVAKNFEEVKSKILKK